MSTILLIPQGLTDKKQEEVKKDVRQYIATRDCGRKFKKGDTLIIPTNSVLHYYSLGWIQLESKEYQELVSYYEDSLDEMAIAQEDDLTATATKVEAMTLATATEELKKELAKTMIPAKDVQKMIEVASQQAAAQALSDFEKSKK